jgi:hypothetical protein
MSISTLLATKAEIVDEWETQSQADPTGFHVNVLEMGGADPADTIWDEVMHGTKTARQLLGVLLPAFAAAKVSGGGTATVTFRDTEDGFDAIIMTVDASGNRSAVTINFS